MRRRRYSRLMTLQETLMGQHRVGLEQALSTRRPGTPTHPARVASLAVQPFDVGHWCGSWFFVDGRGLAVGVVRGEPVGVQFEEYDPPRLIQDALAYERAKAEDALEAMVRRAKYGAVWLTSPVNIGEL